MNHHRLPLFGQKAGIILDSADWSHSYIFFRFLKKKDDNSWEKPSLGEGKNIKFNLLEIIAIINVLQKTNSKWSTVHRFGDENTPINFENKQGGLAISVPGYQKFIKFPETELLLKLLMHILDEKIEYSTGINTVNTTVTMTSSQTGVKEGLQEPKISSMHKINNLEMENKNSIGENDIINIDKNQSQIREKSEIKSNNSKSNPKQENDYSAFNAQTWLDMLQTKEDMCLVPGEIMAKSEKAIAFQINGQNQIWVPLSCTDQTKLDSDILGLWIKRWFLEKKISDIFPLNEILA